MIASKINLYILSFNKYTLTHDVLSLNQDNLDLPSIDIEPKDNQSLETLLSLLFENYIDLSSSFIQFKLCDAFLINNNLVLTYFCVVPFLTRTKNSFFISSKDYANNTKNLPNILRSF